MLHRISTFTHGIYHWPFFLYHKIWLQLQLHNISWCPRPTFTLNVRTRRVSHCVPRVGRQLNLTGQLYTLTVNRLLKCSRLENMTETATGKKGVSSQHFKLRQNNGISPLIMAAPFYIFNFTYVNMVITLKLNSYFFQKGCTGLFSFKNNGETT